MIFQEKKITILGIGSYGSALAQLLSGKVKNVCLWGRSESVVEEVNHKHTNEKALKNIFLKENISATTNLEQALLDTALIVIALPAQTVKNVLMKNVCLFPPNVPFVCCSKGIDVTELSLMDEVIIRALPDINPDNFFYLSGPSFAQEIAEQRPTAICLAGVKGESRKQIQEIFSTSYFRVYTTEDVKGLEVAGSLKNIIAIGAGIISGLSIGKNSEAAIITRGLAEIARFGKKMGADPITFLGLAGIGDLVLTCNGKLSRNRTFGFELSQGRKVDDILTGMGHVVEGVSTVKAVYELSSRHEIEMPITEQLYNIIFHGHSPKSAINNLMTRGLKDENECSRGI